MSIARKGSRSIEVADQRYRWVVSPDSGYMVLVIEPEDEPGQRLEVLVNYSHADTNKHDVVVTPSVVRRAIELALLEGWRPAARGLPPFRLSNSDRITHSGESCA
jgi:hypothetical protein